MPTSALMPDIGRVLSHPLRLRLLFEYREPVNPAAIARRTGLPLNVVSYHTRVLARDRCVELVHTERRRGAVTHFYRASVEPLIEDAQWHATSLPLRRKLALHALALAIEDARRAARAGGFDRPQ